MDVEVVSRQVEVSTFAVWVAAAAAVGLIALGLVMWSRFGRGGTS